MLKIKSLEAFEKAADGQATKIIIPSEIQGLAGLATSVRACTRLLKDQRHVLAAVYIHRYTLFLLILKICRHIQPCRYGTA